MGAVLFDGPDSRPGGSARRIHTGDAIARGCRGLGEPGSKSQADVPVALAIRPRDGRSGTIAYSETVRTRPAQCLGHVPEPQTTVRATGGQRPAVVGEGHGLERPDPGPDRAPRVVSVPSRITAVPSWRATASIVPSGEKARPLTAVSIPGNVPRRRPLGTSQSRTSDSKWPAVASRVPSGESARAATAVPHWQTARLARSRRVATSQSFTTPAESPEASRAPSAVKASTLMPPRCPPRTSTSRHRANPTSSPRSSPPRSTRPPPAAGRPARTRPSWPCRPRPPANPAAVPHPCPRTAPRPRCRPRPARAPSGEIATDRAEPIDPRPSRNDREPDSSLIQTSPPIVAQPRYPPAGETASAHTGDPHSWRDRCAGRRSTSPRSGSPPAVNWLAVHVTVRATRPTPSQFVPFTTAFLRCRHSIVRVPTPRARTHRDPDGPPLSTAPPVN